VKTLVFLLVLGNLLFYAFSAGYFGRPDNPDAVRLDKQVLPERMRIVSRGDAPAGPVKAPEPVVVEAKAEEAAKVEVVAKPEEKPVCLLWEHLPVAEADQLGTVLAGRFAEFKLTRQLVAAEGSGWWVFVPPLPSKAAAEKKAGELRQFGITDYFIVPDGFSRYAISLGVFSSEKGGQDRLAELKDKGIRSARLAPRPGKDSTVSLQATGPATAKPALLEAVGKLLPKAEAQGCK
jgi:hypothetical protein